MMGKNTLLLLLAALVLSFAPLFARFIQMDAGPITWWRCLVASIILGVYLLVSKQIRAPRHDLKWMLLSGTLLGVHWWLFYLSIQTANVSIGVLTLFTYPLFTALLEPLTQKTRPALRQLIGGMGIVIGVYILVPEFTPGNSITLGVVFGLLSALLYALRNLVTKSCLSRNRAMNTLFYQLIFALLAISLLLGYSSTSPGVPAANDLLLIVILALAFTVGGHGLMTHCLTLFSASTVGIVSSIQVVLSTLLAFIILSEVPTPQFYSGAVIIVSIAIYELLPRNHT